MAARPFDVGREGSYACDITMSMRETHPVIASVLGLVIGPVVITVGFLAGGTEGMWLRLAIASVVTGVLVAAVIRLRYTAPAARGWDTFVIHVLLGSIGGLVGFLAIAWLLGRMAQIG
jgi:peptidoglycan biosynthesis protein MviN/MurJ (putative lipid II flippase)